MGWKYRVKQILCHFVAVKKSVYYRFDRTLTQETTAQKSTAQKSNDPAEFTTASSQEVSVGKIVRDLYGNEQTEQAFYGNYVQQGIEHWAALHNGTAIGVVWLYTGYYLAQWEGYDAWLLHVETEPSAKFVCNVFVSPGFRGQGVFPVMARRCFAEYSDSEFYSCIASNNTSSRRSHEKIGFRQCAAAYYFRFFQTTFCYFVTSTGKRRFFRMPKGKVVKVSLIDDTQNSSQ